MLPPGMDSSSMSVSATPPHLTGRRATRGLGSFFVIRSHLSAWANVTLALAGPALVALLGTQLEPNPITLTAHAIGLFAIMLITLGVYAWAIFGEGYPLRSLGFGQCSWATPVLAITLTTFFVLVF